MLVDGELHRTQIRWCYGQALRCGDLWTIIVATKLLDLNMSQMRRLYRRL